jgi:plasmid stabilization system protein ParE
MSNAVWSALAREDLKEIGRYIGRTQYRPSIAAKVMREIRSHCDFLAHSPQSGTARPDLGDDIRVTSCKRWVIVFRPSTNGIEVLRIVDGSRDWAQLFWGCFN